MVPNPTWSGLRHVIFPAMLSVANFLCSSMSASLSRFVNVVDICVKN